MNLIQFIILGVILVIVLFALIKNKKAMDSENKYFFKSGLLAWIVFVLVIVVNSGVFSPKLPEELGGGAEHKSQMEENVDSSMLVPVLKQKNERDYSKEGKASLDKALK